MPVAGNQLVYAGNCCRPHFKLYNLMPASCRSIAGSKNTLSHLMYTRSIFSKQVYFGNFKLMPAACRHLCRQPAGIGIIVKKRPASFWHFCRHNVKKTSFCELKQGRALAPTLFQHTNCSSFPLLRLAAGLVLVLLPALRRPWLGRACSARCDGLVVDQEALSIHQIAHFAVFGR